MSHHRNRLCSSRTPFDLPGAQHLLQPCRLCIKGRGMKQLSLLLQPGMLSSLSDFCPLQPRGDILCALPATYVWFIFSSTVGKRQQS